MTSPEPLPLRVFVSYSRKDRELVVKIVERLEELGVRVIWDQSIQPGSRFSRTIQDSIARSHIFLPFLTENSLGSPWVHQETGYAVGVNVPVMPVAIKGCPNIAMTNEIQTIFVREDLRDLDDQITRARLEGLITSQVGRLPFRQVTVYPEQRTETLVQYSRDFEQSGQLGSVRQRAIFTSFSLPIRGATRRTWDDFLKRSRPNKFQRDFLEQERAVLTQHFMGPGNRCYLLVNPYVNPKYNGPRHVLLRLQLLLDFLEHQSDDKVAIVVSKSVKKENLTIVGDLFAAEAREPHPSIGYGYTVFTSHGPTVYRLARDFDREFNELKPPEDGRSLREQAIEALRKRQRKVKKE